MLSQVIYSKFTFRLGWPITWNEGADSRHRDGMLVILGIAVVFAAVFGGFLLEKGNPYVLMQPAELLIVGGAAVGIVLVANPSGVIRAHGARHAKRVPPPGAHRGLLPAQPANDVRGVQLRPGGREWPVWKPTSRDPGNSRIFSQYPELLADSETLEFVCDSLRMLVIGATTPNELDQLMDLDIEVQRRGRHEPVAALSSVADSLPGLGIVAAVLGVVITMEAIGGSPELIGQKVAAALVGTFLGILLCLYGVVGPLASRLETQSEAETQFPASAAHHHRGVRQGGVADSGGGVRAAVDPHGIEARVPRYGEVHPARSQDSGGCQAARGGEHGCRSPDSLKALQKSPRCPPGASRPPRRHGGAWKVAYADFVTANDGAVHRAVADERQQRGQAVRGRLLPRPLAGTRALSGRDPAVPERGLIVGRDNVRGLQSQIEAALRRAPEFQKIRGNVKLTVTGEGLRVDLIGKRTGHVLRERQPPRRRWPASTC